VIANGKQQLKKLFTQAGLYWEVMHHNLIMNFYKAIHNHPNKGQSQYQW
jgi:hypothetical protein